MIISLANIKIEINNLFDFLLKLCKDYLCEGEPDFFVEVTDEEIEKERNSSELQYSDGYLESVCAYRKIGQILPHYNAFILHSAAVEIDGNAYLFLAKSKVGKTTHIRFLKELLGDRLTIINGDKPIVRFIDDKPFVFGTAWQGKENFGCNKSAPIKALVFLQRGEKSEITHINSPQAALLLMRQILIPKDEETAKKALSLADKILNETKLYSLFATNDIESAKVSFSMIGEENGH